MNRIFLGQPPANIKKWIIEHYHPTPQQNDELKLVVQTTGSYMKSGIYSATRDDASKPVTIDWGDGTVEEVDDDISQKVHEYSSEGIFNVIVKNIKAYAASANNHTWYNTTSQNAYTLKEVAAMPDGVQEIGDHAFANCTSLSSVTIPDGVQTISESAFEGCTSLQSVTLGNGVQTIGNYAFSGCTSLSSVTIPDSVQMIGNDAFSYCPSLQSVMIPDSVHTISESAFSDCTSLISVTIGNSVQTINDTVFYNCTSLALVTIPDSVQTINDAAFSGCTSLTSVTIPDSVQKIGADAFYECTSVTDVYCYPDPADFTWDEDGCNDFKEDAQTICHVKAEYLEAYVSKFTGVVNVTFAGDLS